MAAAPPVIPPPFRMGEPSRSALATFIAERSQLQRITSTTIDGKGKGKGLLIWARRGLGKAWAACLAEVPGAANSDWAQQWRRDEFLRAGILQLQEDEGVAKAKRRKSEAHTEAKAREEARAEAQRRDAELVRRAAAELAYARSRGRASRRSPKRPAKIPRTGADHLSLRDLSPRRRVESLAKFSTDGLRRLAGDEHYEAVSRDARPPHCVLCGQVIYVLVLRPATGRRCVCGRDLD